MPYAKFSTMADFDTWNAAAEASVAPGFRYSIPIARREPADGSVVALFKTKHGVWDGESYTGAEAMEMGYGEPPPDPPPE